MQDQNDKINYEQMNAPSFKLLVTTPMAAIMQSGNNYGEWSILLKDVAPVYADAAKTTHGEIKDALQTVAFILQGDEKLLQKYFEGDNLNFEGMMEISATGADVWMCKLSDGDVKKPDIIKLFKAIKKGLIETTGKLRKENEMIDQIIQVQDKVIEHINSLN